MYHHSKTSICVAEAFLLRLSAHLTIFSFLLGCTYGTLDDLLPSALFPIGVEEVYRESHNNRYDDDVGPMLAVNLCTSRSDLMTNPIDTQIAVR